MAPVTSFAVSKAYGKFRSGSNFKEMREKREIEEAKTIAEWDKKVEHERRISATMGIKSFKKPSDDGEVKHGTGAPVYDSQPYGDLMAMLEEQRPTTGKYRRW
eukprot:FR741208.1.p2 GENE.FR741208.1~~FR741208.1.p2  ORF type:complete len:103 (+),score=10.89 FR741208.1:410-718(+)